MLNDITTESRRWLGVPWRHQGRNEFGLDCAGLVLVVGQRLGHLDLDVDVSGYQRNASSFDFLTHFRNHMDRASLGPNTVGVFRESRYPCHCGIIGLMNHHLSLIHACSVSGKVVEEYWSEKWASKSVAFFQFKGV